MTFLGLGNKGKGLQLSKLRGLALRPHPAEAQTSEKSANVGAGGEVPKTSEGVG